MDIIDILIAKSITPQGQMDSALIAAQQAARDATAASASAQDSMTVALTARNSAEQYASAASAAVANISTSIDSEIDKLAFELIDNEITPEPAADITHHFYDLEINYPSGKTVTLQNIIKLYDMTGEATDGTMTQRAISAMLNDLTTSNETLSTWIAELENRIENIESGDITFSPEDAGKILVVGTEGQLTVSNIYESDIVQSLISTGIYELDNVVGVEIDYVNRTCTRLQAAQGKHAGSDFNAFTMYNKRERVVVDGEGNIVANLLGDGDFREAELLAGDSEHSDWSVMVYQPKFYYMRVPTEAIDNSYGGRTIRKEVLLLSDNPQNGFKLHPLFVDDNGHELEYVLFSAYEGSNSNSIDDSTIDSNSMLQSVVGAKPISGANKTFTIEMAENMAEARGEGWHITDLKFESCQQMLQMVEYGYLNGQENIELGLVNLPNVTKTNCSATTGSTSTLARASGSAESSNVTINGNTTTYTDIGQRAISYRGLENPWGNTWRMVGGIKIIGANKANGGSVYICENRNFNTGTYINTNFMIPNSRDYISGFNYVSPEYDWIYLPSESYNANSALPIGDNFWLTPNLRGTNMMVAGGAWNFNEGCGPFCCAFDRGYTISSPSGNARLMFIPDATSNSYSSNVEKMNQPIIV